MGHFSRCMRDSVNPGSCCYIERVIRVIEALEKYPGKLEPEEQRLADRIFDSSSQLTDEQLTLLEHSLFPD